MNTRGEGASDTAILITILSFQAMLITLLGFISINPETQNVDTTGVLPFMPNIISNIEVLGWGNLVLFSPIIGGLTFIILRFLRGNG